MPQSRQQTFDLGGLIERVYHDAWTLFVRNHKPVRTSEELRAEYVREIKLVQQLTKYPQVTLWCEIRTNTKWDDKVYYFVAERDLHGRYIITERPDS